MNRRFRFRLERLKRVRAIEERVARATWSAAEKEAADAEALLARYRGQIESARRVEPSQDPAPFDPRRALLDRDVVDGLLRGLLPRKETALTRRSQATMLATAWRERKRDHRALEELESRARAGHRDELQRHENREMDETALTRSMRESDSSLTRAKTDEGDSGS